MTIAEKSHGTILASTTLGTIAEVGDIKGPELSRDDIDVTSHDSPDDFEEFINGIKKSGNVTFKCFFVGSDPSHSGLWGLYSSGDSDGFTITTPVSADVLSFDAIVTGIGPDFPVNGVVSADVTLKVTGAVTLNGA